MSYIPPAAASGRKQQILAKAHRYLIPNRVDTFGAIGVDFVIGKRDGYRIWDVDGHELLDFHLNGGTYNVGHRNPRFIKILQDALTTLDIGNHHFASEARAELAEKLARATGLHYSILTPSGSEANDMAIKSARRYTGRRKIVAIDSAYHGRSGLSGAAGDDSAAKYFNSDYPEEFIRVPFDDLEAMEQALRDEQVAAVLMESIPATYGFPLPSPDYLPGVRALCDRYGSLYIADEVQTGLGRSGHLWAVETWGVKPDMLVCGKGLSAGLYPISALVMSEEVGGWLTDNGWGYVTTFGGAEPGCLVASAVLDLCSKPETLHHVTEISDYLYQGLQDIQSRHDYLTGINRLGLIMGLKFDHPNGGVHMTKALYDQGLWAIFAGFDASVTQFKGGLLIDRPYCDLALEKVEAAIKVARDHRDDGTQMSIGR
ncbi:MAG: aminotransferase class III-fold pyridoxal phosphate-dependent enzyme [Halioglobus sp.]